MNNKLKIGILFGGRSPEHNISLLSAKNVIENIDKTKFEVVLLPIDRNGHWHFDQMPLQLSNPDDPKKISLPSYSDSIYLSQNAREGDIVSKSSGKKIAEVDVLFPVLHGTFGEDGSIQGLAKIAGLPCVGCSVLGSSLGMDKDVTKRLLRDARIGIADFITLRKGYNEDLSYEEVSSKLGPELFVKPANLGSSVGVSYVDNEKDYTKAVADGLLYDPKVIIEEKITGREIECAVLGNETIAASTIGEILPKTEWYTFENKYVDDDGAGLAIPAEISDHQLEKARKIAIESFRCLELSGLSRVDMFLKSDGDIIVNEVNTIPGFTKISMYPKLWNHGGIAYKDLISKLIELALQKFDAESKLKV